MGLYQPVVTDNRADYIAKAAEINANAMSQLGQNIGGALASIGSSFSDSIKDAREGESAYGALQVMAQMYPSMGKMVKGLDELDQRTRNMAARQVLGNFGALSQFGIAGMNAGVRQQQMGVQMAMPMNRAAATAAGNAAAGQATVRPMTMPGVDLNFVD